MNNYRKVDPKGTPWCSQKVPNGPTLPLGTRLGPFGGSWKAPGSLKYIHGTKTTQKAPTSCKTGSAAENQNFALDPTTGFLVHDSNCVTASVPLPPAPNGTGAEAHVYGEMVFLSNYAEYTTGTVQYRGKAYFLLNHSLVMALICC